MVRLGIEELLSKRADLLYGKRVGLVANYAVTHAGFQPAKRILEESAGWRLSKLFGPEHGVKNCAQEGERVDTSVDEATGLPAISLYGPNKKPTPEMLEDLDVLVVDLHDIGCFEFLNNDGPGRPFIDLLAGGSQLREFIQQGRALAYLMESAEQLGAFNREVRQFEIYKN